MFSTLVAGVPLPSWDREVFQAIEGVLLGLPRGEPHRIVSLLNHQDEIYRRVLVDGMVQYEALLGCLVSLGFEVRAEPDGAQVRLPELASALKISSGGPCEP